MSRNQGATPSRFTKLAYAYLQPGTTRSSLSSGKQSASLQRPSKSEEKVCVYSRLLRGAKLADLAQHTRFVCAIPGLLRRPRIRALLKKIRRWHESALCTSIMIGTKCRFAPSSDCIVHTLDPSSVVVFAQPVMYLQRWFCSSLCLSPATLDLQGYRCSQQGGGSQARSFKDQITGLFRPGPTSENQQPSSDSSRPQSNFFLELPVKDHRSVMIARWQCQ